MIEGSNFPPAGGEQRATQKKGWKIKESSQRTNTAMQNPKKERTEQRVPRNDDVKTLGSGVPGQRTMKGLGTSRGIPKVTQSK